MHHREVFRLWRIYPHPAPDKRACRSSGGICEADSRAALLSHFSQGSAYMMQTIASYMQRYRSGHNGADSKSVCAKSTRGFESLPLRQKMQLHHVVRLHFLSQRERILTMRRKSQGSHTCRARIRRIAWETVQIAQKATNQQK